jgi:methyl-accepting chemotaxis protein
MLYALNARTALAAILAGGLIAFAMAFGGVWALSGSTALLLPAAIGLAVAASAGCLIAWRQSQQLSQARAAMDSMPAGLCMFDPSERLVVCNTQYYEMYNLTAADVKPGATLKEVLARRVARGTFSRDPDEYRKQFRASVREGRTMVHEVKTTGDRLLRVTNHPMGNGGWIGLHEDITERRNTEIEHAALQQQDARRAALEEAITGFRARAQNLLQAVLQSTRQMHTAAGSLLQNSSQTVSEADEASQASQRSSTNVQGAAASTTELASSIAEIAHNLSTSADLVRGAAAQAQTTGNSMSLLADATRSIDSVVKLIRGIAEKTNLLALNATIEAARAGEAGRGFSVVAAEVKTLAVQTAKATDDIAGQIGTVQSLTEQAVGAIAAIAAQMSQIDSTTSAVATSVEEQNAATAEISQSVEQAAVVAKTAADVLARVAEATANTRDWAQTVLAESRSVETSAGQLGDEVESFLRSVAG